MTANSGSEAKMGLVKYTMQIMIKFCFIKQLIRRADETMVRREGEASLDQTIFTLPRYTLGLA